MKTNSESKSFIAAGLITFRMSEFSAAADIITFGDKTFVPSGYFESLIESLPVGIFTQD